MRIERVDYGHPDAVRLIAEVQAEYVVRYGGADKTPLDPLMFEPPTGSFFVGYVDGPEGEEPVASGAWRSHVDHPDLVSLAAAGVRRTAEVKRMYVAATHRGHGHARAMLSHLERTAAESGAEAMVLETGTAQPEAIALYTSSGYEAIAPFGHYKDAPLNRCFAKRLPVVSRTRLDPTR
ncbi:GNAT family N-acetyltransferase [Nocardioides sp. YIM 123512]|uniref:GNAT family N-acetyltransferase n=1 Tax=Nocardioides flavescens TaxID=2691959 RepID=A0A6L7EXP1_9ACTN|nr:GNAT family N-acetyltransferase [Nocardioides flavescens]